jgi:hypothetical protein
MQFLVGVGTERHTDMQLLYRRRELAFNYVGIIVRMFGKRREWPGREYWAPHPATLALLPNCSSKRNRPTSENEATRQ